jgi:DNA uptake protein ComE-like DNA-binding protein
MVSGGRPDESSWVPEELRPARRSANGPATPGSTDWLAEPDEESEDAERLAGEGRSSGSRPAPKTSEWIAIPPAPSAPTRAEPGSTEAVEPAKEGAVPRVEAQEMPESGEAERDEDEPLPAASAEAQETNEWMVLPPAPPGTLAVKPHPPASAEPAPDPLRRPAESAASHIEAAAPATVRGSEPPASDVQAATRAAIAEAERVIREQTEERFAMERERATRAEEEARAAEDRARAAEARSRDAEDRARDAEARVGRLELQLRDAEQGHSDAVEEAERARGQASDQAAAYDARIAELDEQIEELERSARIATERMVAATGGAKRDEAGRVDLNAASVEGLRQLGLSITQAARLVSLREASGGFGSLDELDAVPGLPAGQRDALRDRVYVDPSLARRS